MHVRTHVCVCVCVGHSLLVIEERKYFSITRCMTGTLHNRNTTEFRLTTPTGRGCGEGRGLP